MRALQAKKKQLFKRLFLFLFLSVSWCFWKRDVNWGSFNQDRNRKQGCFGKTTCRFHYLCCQVTLEIEAVDTPLFTAKRKKINKNAMSLWNKNNLTWLVTKWNKNLEFFYYNDDGTGGSKKKYKLPSVRRPPSAVRQCPLPSDSPPTDGPTDHKKLLLTLPLSDVRPGANTVGSILYDVYT